MDATLFRAPALCFPPRVGAAPATPADRKGGPGSRQRHMRMKFGGRGFDSRNSHEEGKDPHSVQGRGLGVRLGRVCDETPN